MKCYRREKGRTEESTEMQETGPSWKQEIIKGKPAGRLGTVYIYINTLTVCNFTENKEELLKGK